MRILRLIPVLLALSFSQLGCGVVEALGECICGPRTGNAKVDAFFDAADDLQAASARAEARVDGALSDLALVLGLQATATPAAVHTALCEHFEDAGSAYSVDYQEPVCRTHVDVAARASAACDVAVDPGEVDIECKGRCEGTCRAECTGECRLPSVDAYCQGTCHGTCEVPVVVAECYGTCHGTCTETCSVEVGGECHGSCEGLCEGTCEIAVSGGCTGECHGECAVNVNSGHCNARCEGTCEGRCEGYCDGNVEAPQVDADCQAQVEARAEAYVECVPPHLTFAQDTTAVTNITLVSHHLGRVLAASAEVDGVIAALGNFATPLGDTATTLVTGELSAEAAACATTKLGEASDAIDGATQTLANIATTEAIIVAPCL